jgi:hypothetical protein
MPAQYIVVCPDRLQYEIKYDISAVKRAPALLMGVK